MLVGSECISAIDARSTGRRTRRCSARRSLRAEFVRLRWFALTPAPSPSQTLVKVTSSVTLAGIEVGEISFENDTYVVVKAGASAEAVELGDVVLTADTGATVTFEEGFEY